MRNRRPQPPSSPSGLTVAPTHSSRPPRPARDRRAGPADRLRGPPTPTRGSPAAGDPTCRRARAGPPRARRAARAASRRFTPRAPLLPCLAAQHRRSSANKLQARRTIFISHNASSVGAALRPPPTPSTVPLFPRGTLGHRPSLLLLQATPAPLHLLLLRRSRACAREIDQRDRPGTRSTSSSRTCTARRPSARASARPSRLPMAGQRTTAPPM